jgi:Uma2 family endonuclease
MTVLDAPTTVKIRTAGELLRALGDVPPERVRIVPAFMNATEQHLLHVLHQEKVPCELVDGVLVEKPMGWKESFLTQLLARILGLYVDEHDLGAITGPDGPYRLRIGLVRLPDIAFVSWSRVQKPAAQTEAIPSIVPDLGIEVLSESNRPAEIKRKLEEYFTAGVTLVWIVDPDRRTVSIHTSPARPDRVLGAGEVLDGATVVPGFQLSLDRLFSALDRLPPSGSAGQNE